jgi:glycosyltransferase involved in cell wall biosynthesis
MGKTNDLFPVLDALKILEARRIPVRGIICGDGEKASLLKSRVKECGNVLFPGWISAHQIKSLLEIADVGIAPYINSQNYINNIPNKPAEYLSGGLVIALSLNNGNLYELLTERQCGFTYDNKAEKLAEQLEFLAKSPNQLASMQANSRATFYDSFDGAMIYNQLITFMEQLASVK